MTHERLLSRVPILDLSSCPDKAHECALLSLKYNSQTRGDKGMGISVVDRRGHFPNEVKTEIATPVLEPLFSSSGKTTRGGGDTMRHLRSSDGDISAILSYSLLLINPIFGRWKNNQSHFSHPSISACGSCHAYGTALIAIIAGSQSIWHSRVYRTGGRRRNQFKVVLNGMLIIS